MIDNGETLTHIYAKEILDLADTIVVPRVTGMPWKHHEGVELRPDRELEILSVEIDLLSVVCALMFSSRRRRQDDD